MGKPNMGPADRKGVVGAKSVVVVGGGLSGASFALQLSRATRVPLAISIVEPRAALGRGLPYSTDDPDHRLNGPLDMHTLDPARPRSCANGRRNQAFSTPIPPVSVPAASSSCGGAITAAI